MEFMTSDLQALFANLAEQERIKGHHSAEGRAIRTLSRALSGWSSSQLHATDVLILALQAVEDWLKARLQVSPWSKTSRSELLAEASEKKLISVMDAVKFQRIRNLLSPTAPTADLTRQRVEEALIFCIHLV